MTTTKGGGFNSYNKRKQLQKVINCMKIKYIHTKCLIDSLKLKKWEKEETLKFGSSVCLH